MFKMDYSIVSCYTRKTYFGVDVKDPKHKCDKGTFTQYVHRFIRKIKDILRDVNDLRDVRIHISLFDVKNNLHQWMVSVIDIMKDMFSLHIQPLHRTIFIYIQKKNQILFLGNIQI